MSPVQGLEEITVYVKENVSLIRLRKEKKKTANNNFMSLQRLKALKFFIHMVRTQHVAEP